MAALAPLRLDVAEILDRPGASRSFRGHLAVPADGARAAFDVDGDLRIHAIPDGVVVSGTLLGRAHPACSRCLEGFDLEVEVEISEVFLDPGEETADAEAYPLEGAEIDLEPLIREAVALSLPAYPHCREDCPGLCPICGTNLKTSSCDCTPPAGDPRFAILAELDLPKD